MTDACSHRFAAVAGGLIALALVAAPGADAHAAELVVVGSGNVSQILEHAGPGYMQQRAGTTLVIESRPSSAGPPALLAGRAQLAAMSREMTPDELLALEKRLGRPPERVSIAIDALAVFVNEKNPLREITLGQLDAIFSRGRACGAPEAIAHWAGLGLSDGWESRRIGLYGHVASAGTHAFFRAHVLCGGHFRDEVIEQPGGRSIAHSVAESRFAMGYSARADRIDGVRSLAIGQTADGPFGSVEAADVYSGAYPLTRDLYLYRIDDPTRPEQNAQVRDFLRFLLGEEGQRAVEAVGFLRLPSQRIDEELARLD